MKDRERERVGEEKERERGNGIEKKQKKAAFFFFFFSSSGKCSTGFFLFFNRRWTSMTTTKVFSFTMRRREDKRGDNSLSEFSNPFKVAIAAKRLPNHHTYFTCHFTKPMF